MQTQRLVVLDQLARDPPTATDFSPDAPDRRVENEDRLEARRDATREARPRNPPARVGEGDADERAKRRVRARRERRDGGRLVGAHAQNDLRVIG